VIPLGDKLWEVNNYEGEYLGSIDLQTATVHSDNSVYAQLTSIVGPQNVARMARNAGIQSKLNSYFAIGLGAEAANPLEMARAYATFANNGNRIDGSILGNQPRAITQIGKRRNEVVPHRVLSPTKTASDRTPLVISAITSGRSPSCAIHSALTTINSGLMAASRPSQRRQTVASATSSIRNGSERSDWTIHPALRRERYTVVVIDSHLLPSCPAVQ
jgi:membrane carboxypeptidase/penicillin-binding protein